MRRRLFTLSAVYLFISLFCCLETRKTSLFADEKNEISVRFFLRRRENRQKIRKEEGGKRKSFGAVDATEEQEDLLKKGDPYMYRFSRFFLLHIDR